MSGTSDLAECCKKIREETKWSQDELGEFLGLSKSTVQRYESGLGTSRQKLNEWVIEKVYVMVQNDKTLKKVKEALTFEEILESL